MPNSNTNKRPTIMQVLPSLFSGGVERGAIEVSKTLVAHGYHSIVVSSGGSMVDQIEEHGAKHVKLNLASRNPLRIIYNIFALKKLIKTYNVDIVHARSRAPAWSAYFASKLTNTRFMTTFHGIYKTNVPFKKLYNSVMLKGNPTIAVSDFVRHHILNTYPKRYQPDNIVVIHRGADIDYFNQNYVSTEEQSKMRDKYRAPVDIPLLLLPARMTKWKGHEVLINALSKLGHREFYCIIVGDLSKHPNFVKFIRELIKKHKMQGKVEMFGNEPDMRALYSIADVVLSTSIEPEAFGRTIVEAQAMGKIVIASNIGGATETIQHKVNGFHYLTHDPESLANTVEEVLDLLGSSQAQEISKNASISSRRDFSLEKVLRKTLDVYQEIIHEIEEK